MSKSRILKVLSSPEEEEEEEEEEEQQEEEQRGALLEPAFATRDAAKNHTVPMRSTCHVPSFNFFLAAVSEIQRSKNFPFFQHSCHTM